MSGDDKLLRNTLTNHTGDIAAVLSALGNERRLQIPSTLLDEPIDVMLGHAAIADGDLVALGEDGQAIPGQSLQGRAALSCWNDIRFVHGLDGSR